MFVEPPLFTAQNKMTHEFVVGYYVFCRKRHYILPIVSQEFGYDEREDGWIEIDERTLRPYI